jgi:DNA-directed RNA polymerase subunit RPC12/RpoP
MSSGARDLLVRGIAAAKAKDKDEARFYLERVTITDADRQQKAQAWLWLSGLTDDLAERRDCLEEVLVLDPSNVQARRGLAILQGRLDPDEIIDPDRQPPPPQEQETTPQPITSQRFVCQNCGGKMAFKPDGKSLRCEYCGDEQSLYAAMNSGAMVQEHDFVVAMATIKGHTRPVATHLLTCQACGATFLLAPDVLSLSCSYCGSAHVVQLPETRELIPPEGLIPFAVSQEQAQRAFHQWLKKKKLRDKVKITPVRGVYLPAWTFDLAGELRWQCYAYRDEGPGVEVSGLQVSLSGSGHSRKQVREEGNHPVYEDDVLVLAGHKLPPDLRKELDQFLLGDVVPYDHAYLADWPAEVYQIPVSDASLVARRKVLEKAQSFVKTRLSATMGSVSELQLNTAGLIVESYKLILLPLWVARYRHQQTIYHAIVNGQTGQVRAQMPRNWLQKFFGSIFD